MRFEPAWMALPLAFAMTLAHADSGLARLSEVGIVVTDLDPNDGYVPPPLTGANYAAWEPGILKPGGINNEPGWYADRAPGTSAPPIEGAHEITDGATFARMSLVAPSAAQHTLESAAGSTEPGWTVYAGVRLGNTGQSSEPAWLVALAPNTSVTLSGEALVRGEVTSYYTGTEFLGVASSLAIQVYDADHGYLSSHGDELSLMIEDRSFEEQSGHVSVTYANTSSEWQYASLQAGAALFMTVGAVPEPHGLALMLVGVGALALRFARARATRA